MFTIADLLDKFELNWNFKKDDWFIQLVFSHPEIMFDICRLKEYNSNKIPTIVYDICTIIKEYRSGLELESPEFLKKKKYLEENVDNDKIQITLEEEYLLKDLIDKFKIYELIGWLHLGRNPKIFQQCVLEKQKILNLIVPIIDNSVRAVIGSKVISDSMVNIDGNMVPLNIERHQLFEACVNNAYLAIIKYLTKIDTSKVMFSVLVATAHNSARWYKYNYLKKTKYNETRMSDFGFITDDDNDNEDAVSESVFYDTVMTNNCSDNYMEDELIEQIDNELFNKDLIDYDMEDAIEETLSEIDGSNTYKQLTNNILDYNKSILNQKMLVNTAEINSGKIKRICFDKIFAEFFNDLINGKISRDIIDKHSSIIIEIMDLISVNPNMVNDINKNVELYKALRGWIKEKKKQKLSKMNINSKNKENEDYINEVAERENTIIKYLKENKNEVLVNLVRFKNECLSTGKTIEIDY